MLKIAVLVLSAVALASAGEINFQDCGSLGTIHSVQVPGCSGSERCVFRKGQTYEIDTRFTAANSGSTANLEVKAAVSIITVDIIRPGNNNGCPGFTPGCPYTAGNTHTHRTTMTIDDQFIETDATVTFRLLNAANGAEVCFRAPARVSNS